MRQAPGFAMMRVYQAAIIILVLLVLSACNLSTQPPTAEPIDVPTQQAGGKPTVTITSPETGDEVVVNAQIFVTANATDSVGVTRVQLIAGNQVVKTVSSESPAGQTNFPVLLDYTPRETGEVELQVIAFRGATASDPAEVTINVRANQAQVTATIAPNTGGGGSFPVIDPNDPTCRALTNTGLNLRFGPGTNYDRLRVLAAGSVVPIIGRLADNSWWQVRSNVDVGWVFAQYTSVYGVCTAVPVVAAPPSPTPPGFVPTATPSRTPTPTNTPAATNTPGRPDLVITNISGPSTVNAADGLQTYSVTISNTGSGASGAFANRVSLPDGSLSDLGVVANLAAGESISLNFTVDFSVVGPGTYGLEAQTDSEGQVAEISEVNNSAALRVTVN